MNAPSLEPDAPLPPAPFDTTPRHIPATSLIDPPPIAPRPPSQAPDLKEQPASDLHARIPAFSGSDSFLKDGPKVGGETELVHDPGSTAEFPPIKAVDIDAVTPSVRERLMAEGSPSAAVETIRLEVPTEKSSPAQIEMRAEIAQPAEPAEQIALGLDDTAPAARVGGIAARESATRAVVVESASPVAVAIEQDATEAVERITAKQLAVASSDQLAPEAERPEFVTGEPIEVEEEPVEKGISVITREATVLGDIITEGHIDIVGRVKGNIDAKGDVAIHGIVRGDIDGSKIGLYSCRVKGNLNAGLGVIVDDSSVIGGDVKTKNIIFDGKVKGNIDADNVVVLRSHSYCLGDVSAASLAVEPGAILIGKVRTFVDGDLEAPFDEVM
jgi:cytoskeletal protein CcmA (bactofilin family)